MGPSRGRMDGRNEKYPIEKDRKEEEKSRAMNLLSFSIWEKIDVDLFALTEYGLVG